MIAHAKLPVAAEQVSFGDIPGLEVVHDDVWKGGCFESVHPRAHASDRVPAAFGNGKESFAGKELGRAGNLVEVLNVALAAGSNVQDQSPREAQFGIAFKFTDEPFIIVRRK